MDLIAVRKAVPTDVTFLVQAQVRMAFETERMTLAPDTVTLGVARVFQEPELGQYFVCEVGGKLAGCLLITREWSEWRNLEIWWIQSVFTEPEFRGQGVFKSLYAHVKGLVQSRPDVGGLRLYMEHDNHSARRVYEKLGMSSHYLAFEWMK